MKILIILILSVGLVFANDERQKNADLQLLQVLKDQNRKELQNAKSASEAMDLAIKQQAIYRELRAKDRQQPTK